MARNDGNTADALSKATKVIEAEYFTPYLAHATMEPMVCTAWLQGDQLDVWCSTQNPESTLAVAAATAGVPQANVKVHPMQLGGGLGRKSPQDFTRQAVAIAKAMPGKPIKMLWSREEEIQHGLYRPASLMRFKAGLSATGKAEALHIRVSAPSILATLLKLPLPRGVDGQAVASFNDHPYDIPNTLVDYAQRNTNVPVGFWRTVGHSQNPFGRECFIDEIGPGGLAKTRWNTALAMLPNNEKANRDRAILLAVTKAAGWDKKPAPGVFRGVAATDGYGSWTACVCDVSINAKNEVKIHRIVIGIDPGYAVNPDNIVAQLPGQRGARFDRHLLGRKHHQGRACGAIQLPRLPDDAFERNAQGRRGDCPHGWFLGRGGRAGPGGLWHPLWPTPYRQLWANASAACP